MTWIKQPTEKLLSAETEPRGELVVMRQEEPRDGPQIRDLLEASFPGSSEALLVDRLRSDGDIVLSLVADDLGVVVGYIAFSRLKVEDGGGASFHAVALAPIAIYPEYQQWGVATRLVQESHACLAAIGETLCVVLGEPQFYSRFGYSNRRIAGFQSEFQSPYLMGLSFGAAPSEGRLVYPPAFAALSDNAPLPVDDRV